MDTYIPKKRIRLSFAGSNDHRYIRIDFGGDGVLRGCLAQEEEISFREGIAYIPADKFELSAFFDRHMVMAFIDYSAIKSAQEKPRSAAPTAPPLPPGILEKLKQVRYSDHTVRVYTTYFKDFQAYFEGKRIDRITPEEINAYLVYLINERSISSCQQNQRINAIKFYYEKVLGQPRRCYTVNRAKREKTLPDVLSKEEVKAILSAVVTDMRFWCMFSVLYPAGLRISELLSLSPDDITCRAP